MTKYKALTTFLHDQLGRVHIGDEVEMTAQQAQAPMMFGWVDPINDSATEVQSEVTAAAPVRRTRKAKSPE